MPDIQSTSCRKLNCCTGMEGTNPGTSQAFTTTCGKAGLSLILQGYLSSITTADRTQRFKYSLWEKLQLSLCSLATRLLEEQYLWHVQSTTREPETSLCRLDLGPDGHGCVSLSPSDNRGGHDSVSEACCWKERNPAGYGQSRCFTLNGTYSHKFSIF